MTYLRNAVYFFGILLAVSLSGCGGGGGGSDTVTASSIEGVWSGNVIGMCLAADDINLAVNASITTDVSGKTDLWINTSSLTLTVAGTAATSAGSMTINIAFGTGNVDVVLSNPSLTLAGDTITGTMDFSIAGVCTNKSVTITTTRVIPTVKPTAPTTLNVNLGTATSLNLSWTDNANNETGFIISRSEDDVTYTEIARVGANAIDYEDTGLTTGTEYFYKVVAYNKIGESTAILGNGIPAT